MRCTRVGRQSGRRGKIHCSAHTFRPLSSLPTGMASPLLGIAAQNSLLFTAFQISKRFVSETPNLSIQQTVAAGAMAGAINSVMASPIELLKIRMQSQYGGTADQKLRQVASQLWKEHGFRRGIMRGFWVCAGWVLRAYDGHSRWVVSPTPLLSLAQITVARETPAYAGFYGGFTKSKEELRKRLYPHLKPSENLPIWCLMASGSVGGICNWLACYPLGA